jgi:hypothetical protein
MRIPAATLLAQYRRASRDWPFIDALELHHGLPRGLLYAVGSRETNLTDKTGDGGHGHGVFQLDDRSHTIPNPFPVALQAELRRKLDPNAVTAGGDYGRDVLDRAAFLQRQLNPPPRPQEAVIVLNQPACAIVATPDGLGYWIVAEDGGVFTYGSAPFVGSEAAKPHNAKFVGAACTPTGKGLWLLGADGGVFTEGDAPFLGSPAGGG